MPESTEAPRYLPVSTVSVRLEDGAITPRNAVFGLVANMSRTGACVITNRGLAVGTPIDVAFSVKGYGELARLAADVIWCAERLEPMKEIVGYFTGVRFMSQSIARVDGLLSSGVFRLVS